VQLLKSVRVRKASADMSERLSGSLDYKVSLFDKGNNQNSVIAQPVNGSTPNGVPIQSEYYRGGFFSSLTDDDIINMSVTFISNKLEVDYEIIQDPWNDVSPRVRNFGFDPYYLNNGSAIFIDWRGGGGKKWSDDDGNELDIPRGDDIDGEKDIRKLFSKIAVIVEDYYDVEVEVESGTLDFEKLLASPDSSDYGGYDVIYVTENGFSKNPQLIKEYSGNNKDIDIVNSIIDLWRRSIVVDGLLSLCDPPSITCGDIDYVSPIREKIPDTISTNGIVVDPIFSDKKLTIVMPGDEVEIRVGEPIENIRVYIGEVDKSDLPIDANAGDFVFSDFGDFSDLIDEQYLGGQFSGIPEEISELETQEFPTIEYELDVIEETKRIYNNNLPISVDNLDLLPGLYKGNQASIELQLCQIDGKPVPVKIANKVLSLKRDARNAGLNLIVISGFRPSTTPINTTSNSGVRVTAQSQKELRAQNCKGNKCEPATAGVYSSKHGSGIAVDFNTGSGTNLNKKLYTWLIKNSWRYGFVRTVASEEWHFELWEKEAKEKGPYAKLPRTNRLFYKDLGLNNLNFIPGVTNFVP
jgi:hypothetical protein